MTAVHQPAKGWENTHTGCPTRLVNQLIPLVVFLLSSFLSFLPSDFFFRAHFAEENDFEGIQVVA